MHALLTRPFLVYVCGFLILFYIHLLIPAVPVLILIAAFMILISRNYFCFALLNFFLGLTGFSPLLLIANGWPATIANAPIHAGAFILYFVLSFVFLRLTISANRNHLNWFIIGTVFTVAMLPLKNFQFYRLFLTIACFNLWSLIFYMKSVRSREQLSLVDFSHNTLNFLMFTPIPPVTTNSTSWKMNTQIELTDEECLRILKITLVNLALLLFHQWIVDASSYIRFLNQIILPSEGIQSGFIFNHTLWLDEPIWMVWLICIASCLYTFMLIYLYFVPSVLLYQIMGFKLKLPAYNLLKSKSLYEFFENFNHYYNKIIVEAFAVPTLSLVKNKHKKQAIIPIFFFSIILCGFVYHYLRRPALFLSSNTIESLYLFLSSTIYWVLLAAAACLSMVFERQQELDGSRYRPLRWLCYLVINSALLVWVMSYEINKSTLTDRLKVFLKLFGLTWYE